MRIVLICALAGAAALGGASVTAQQAPAPVACPSQDALEQYLASDGELVPDGCRPMEIVQVDRDAGPLCVLDFGEGDEGILDTLRDAATTTQWWVACSDLRAAMP